jgi:3,4-dihydroxy 2-butanone 4-phosphate synthase/GTP cyclohydrolase II
MSLSPVPEILTELQAGRLIVLVDDENRENEGDFVCAAEKVTTDIINFMTRVGGGYLCLSLTGPDCDRLELVPQATANTSLRTTAMTVSVDGHPRHGVGTGISAPDRVKTIQLVLDPETSPDDLVRPGHINPLRSRDGGVLVRTGQTEGSTDLARLAGLHPSALIEHGLKMCSVRQIIEYRLAREQIVERLEPHEGTLIETPYGRFNLIAYNSAIDALPHLALTVGDIGNGSTDEPVLVRVHRRDLLGDIFDETSSQSGRTLRSSLKMIQAAGRGALVYLRPEGIGDDLRGRLQQIRRPVTDDVNVPDLTRSDGPAGTALPMDERELGIGSQILRDLGLRRLRIITNHPKKLRGLAGFGIEIVEQVPVNPDFF